MNQTNRKSAKAVARLAALASAGILAGAIVGCENNKTTDKHSCSGQNGCKASGGCSAKASCKGEAKDKAGCSADAKDKASCNAADKHSCKS